MTTANWTTIIEDPTPTGSNSETSFDTPIEFPMMNIALTVPSVVVIVVVLIRWQKKSDDR